MLLEYCVSDLTHLHRKLLALNRSAGCNLIWLMHLHSDMKIAAS
jgi:hypothetical protein